VFDNVGRGEFQFEMKKISEPLLSPFRYPGGKSWLRPIVRQWLKQPTHRLIEPFAGGANITLLAVSEKLVNRATMVELDTNVSAVWQSVLNGQSEWLSKRVESFKPTKANVKLTFRRRPRSLRQKAWVTFVRNRVSYGGLLTPCAGLLKNGENGNGLWSRWYPQTLATRIRSINKLKRRINFISGDGLDWLEKRRNQFDGPQTAYFIDPPYLLAGKRLYPESELNHRRLFEIASILEGRVLMTYDDTSEIRALAREFGFKYRSVRMLSRQHQTKTELLIAKDFSWLKNLKHTRQARSQK
jgi:DNA adenine methylase